LTAEEKDDLKKQVSDAAKEAKGNIDAATKDADVESAKNTGVEKINNINVPDTSANKDAPKKAIDEAAQTKDAAIDKSNLTDEEKADLKKQVYDAANEAKDNIDADTKETYVKLSKNYGSE